jgi:hypothetical protein
MHACAAVKEEDVIQKTLTAAGRLICDASELEGMVA